MGGAYTFGGLWITEGKLLIFSYISIACFATLLSLVESAWADQEGGGGERATGCPGAQ